MSTKKEETRKATIYIIPNTKGGVGKTLISLIVSNLLHSQKRKFKLIEIDDNNKSYKFENSMVINNENAISYKLEDKNDAVNEMFFDSMSDDNLDYIIWYEDSRSITAKIDLAKMFDIEQISVWRLGNIPNYKDTEDLAYSRKLIQKDFKIYIDVLIEEKK